MRPDPMPSRTPARRGRGRLATLVIAVLGAASVTAGLAPGAGAQSIDDKRAEAAQIQDQIEATDLQISALTQDLAVAEARRDAAAQAALEAEAQIEVAKQEVKRIVRLIRKNAASLYRRSMLGNTIDDLDVGDAEDLNRRTRYAKVMADRDDELLDKLDAAQQDLALKRTEATRARDEAAAEGEAITHAKTAMETARAEQQVLLDQVQGELAAAVAAERARRETAARAKFSAGSVSYPDVGPPNGSASQAIAWARGVIGSGYSTNPRMGPTYDCSGLTHMAWRAAGVIIPTVSNTQWAGLPHVPLNAIQPGDLIFWGPGGSSHVALYVGGGMIIDASSSKNAVMERPIWGSPSGAARVT
jgi:peptidoglycan DL-endopeptidase CwlO